MGKILMQALLTRNEIVGWQKPRPFYGARASARFNVCHDQRLKIIETAIILDVEAA
jgi:hypothetical protein